MCSQPSDENKVFDAVTLTNAYTGNTSGGLEIRSNDKFTILAQYAAGAAETGNTCEIEVAYAADDTTYSQHGFWSAAATSTFTATTFQVAQGTNVPISFEGLGRWLRIRAKESGVATNAGTLTLYLYRNKN